MLTKEQVELLTELEACLIDLKTIPSETPGVEWGFYTKYVTGATIDCVDGEIPMEIIVACFDAHNTPVPSNPLIPKFNA